MNIFLVFRYIIKKINFYEKVITKFIFFIRLPDDFCPGMGWKLY